MNDLAIIIVSTNEGHWLEASLSSIFLHAGDCQLDVIVVDNDSIDGTPDVVAAFPEARAVRSANHGFAHANNRGLMTTDARYILFLNPDTEIVAGSFADLVCYLDDRPGLGLIGVVQITASGETFPTIRRFPNAARALGEALGAERLPFRASWLGERELDMSVYAKEVDCDWTSGSFMLARREALESSGYMDERFFIYSEEPDLCLRMKKAGWGTRHVPSMTIIHHANKGGVRPKMSAQDAFTRVQYSRKHFSPLHRITYLGALGLGYTARALVADRTSRHSQRRDAARAALGAVLGRGSPPFGEPPKQAVGLRSRIRDPRP